MVLQLVYRVITPSPPSFLQYFGTSRRFLQGLHLRHHSPWGKNALTSRRGMRDITLTFP